MSAKLQELVAPEFMQSLNKLRYNDQLKASLAWKIVPLTKKIREELENFEAIRIEVCKKYCKKGEDGEPIMLPIGNGETRFIFEPEVQKDFDEEIKALQESIVELPSPVVKVSDINDINLTVADLEVLVGTVLVGE